MDSQDLHYLSLLSRSFPTANSAAAEIINLTAIMSLPKGTEYFISDVHGEYEAFSHILRNASGTIRIKIDELFKDTLSDEEKKSLATLIYYPHEKMRLILDQEEDPEKWYAKAIFHLVLLTRHVSQKYTRSRVRKAISKDFAYIITELITENGDRKDNDAYYNSIISAVIETGQAQNLIEELCLLIQHLSIDKLHIIGDIYDRGPHPDTIIDTLQAHPDVDIVWGNHDVVWMGASLGQWGCIAHVVRNCARYGNLAILEDGYGINLLPLAEFARRTYESDPCVAFDLKGSPNLTERERLMNVRIQKAMAIIQFKVEAALIDKYPSFQLEDRKLLDKIDYERGTVVVDGVEYELTDKVFPTVDPSDPFALTPEEESVMCRLEQAFLGSEKLQRHMRYLLNIGSLYKIYNNNLMFHACVPLNEDGSLMEVDIFGEKYKGRALYDVLNEYVREAFSSQDAKRREKGKDLLWYMWLGQGSPLFAKSKMATFELYLIADKVARKEEKNAFYKLIDEERVIDSVFRDFGMNPENSHIVCGHVPIKVKDGEVPIRCSGKVFMIDGGFSKAYQPTTGIAGYTLISNSYGFVLAAHEPFESMEAAIERGLDIHSTRRVVETSDTRTLIANTDKGIELSRQVSDLNLLLDAYRDGDIPERA